MTARLLFCLAGLLALTACPRQPSPVLTGAWPERPSSYSHAYRAWTQRGVIRDGYDQVLEVHATFKSPPWRAAYVERTAEAQSLSPEARERLIEEMHDQATEGPYEVELLVATHDWRVNDLIKGERSIWRLTLMDDRGNRVEPVSIERDRRPRDAIRAVYPDLDDFAEPYVVRFPRTIDVLRPDAEWFALEMASHLGTTRLVWR